MNKYHFVIAVVVYFAISCKDNSVTPIEIQPGSRSYSWTQDTLKELTPFDHLDEVWGDTENDVWVGGTGGLWNYNGIEWHEYKGMRWNIDCLYGFSENNIWVFASGNYNGANIWHYDGSSWKNQGLFSFTEIDGFLGFSDIKGSSKDNIYAVGIFMFGKGGGGRKAIVMHYNGVEWDFINTGDLKTNLYKISYDGIEKKYFICGHEEKWDTTGDIPHLSEEINKIYEFDGKNLKEIYSSKEVERFTFELNDRVYFISKNQLWNYSNNSFSLFQDFSNHSYTIGSIVAQSEKDMFIYSIKKNSSNWTRHITHYNGTDIESIYESDNIWGFEVIQDDVFVIATDVLGNWIISHGIRQN